MVQVIRAKKAAAGAMKGKWKYEQGNTHKGRGVMTGNEKLRGDEKQGTEEPVKTKFKVVMD